MFVPGFAIMKLLKLENLDIEEKALFSLGLSLTFLMLISLFINEIGKLIFTKPLSPNLLLPSINIAVLLISFLTTKDSSSLSIPQLNRFEKLFLILLITTFLILGSYGTFMVIISGNSLFLLLLIIACATTTIMPFISEKVHNKLYTPILLAISFSIIFFASGTFIVKHISGTGDGPIEFYAFRLTEKKGFWDSAATFSSYAWNIFPTYSMLSVTILPMPFSAFTGADSSLLFNLIYPFIVAFLILGVYKLYQTQTENKVAFLAAFFFFTISVGKGFGSYKQQIAQLLYILLFLLLFKKDVSLSKKSILFIIFSVGLVISHYALTYIFLFTILLAYLILGLIDGAKAGYFSLNQKRIPITLVVIFLTVAFSWYIFVNASAAFNLISEEISTITENLGQFFNVESRGTALQGLGLIETPTIYHQISTALFIITEFLIIVGFLELVISKKRESQYSREYIVIATINMAIIALNILLPRLADTLLMSRFYQTTLIILAPLAVLGGETVIKYIPKIKIQKLDLPILAIIIFIPLFLFQTGFVYELARVRNFSFALSMYRWDEIEIYRYFTNLREVSSAQWLSRNINISNTFVYSDIASQFNVLTGYGMIERGRVRILSNITRPNSGEFAYLASLNLIGEGRIFNIDEVSFLIEENCKVYSNGECELYKCP